MKRGLFWGTGVVLLIVFAGLAGRSLYRRGSAATNSGSHVFSPVIAARAKAPKPASTTPPISAPERETFASNKLFVTAETLWAKPIPEEPFARFHDWAEKFAATRPETRPALESEGIELAKTRRQSLAALIQSDRFAASQ